MDEIEIEQRVTLFYENKTYTFIKLSMGQLFNGYIESVANSTIMFKDDYIGIVPILKAEIELIAYSKKGAKK